MHGFTPLIFLVLLTPSVGADKQQCLTSRKAQFIHEGGGNSWFGYFYGKWILVILILQLIKD